MNLSHGLRIKCNFLKNFSYIEPDIWSTYCRRVGQAAEALKEHLTVKRCKPEHVRFTIGSVMLHRRYNYTCVLYGWDEVCMMNESWQRQMGISQLEHQGNQPYYKVLADDDSERYVAQESLLETRSEFITHRDVGKYFSLYDGERFVPNAALKTIYTYLND
jgi:F-box protein 21